MKFLVQNAPHGRHILSFWASKLFEKSGIKRLFGINLVAAVIFTGVITPEATNLYDQLTIEQQIKNTPITAETTTKSTYELPLADFRISQMFSFWHPGIDMIAEAGTPIYVIEDGEITEVNDTFFGYGKHIIVEHDHQVKTLYAHLSAFKEVYVGKQVGRGELIGYVGSTGWSTGNHLHLEMYIENIPINPLEALPIKTKEIVYVTILEETKSTELTQPNSSPIPTLLVSPQPASTPSALPVSL